MDEEDLTIPHKQIFTRPFVKQLLQNFKIPE